MGIIFYELLSGSLPFRGDNAVEIALKHMREPLPSLREDHPEIPQSIENIIRKATAKNPKNRYETAREMHEDLLTALDDERMNEEPHQYKYPENENDGKKKALEKEAKTAKEAETEEVKKETKGKTKEKVEESKAEEVLTKEDEEDEKVSKTSKIIIIILSIVFVLLMFGLIFVFLILPSLTSTKSAIVPNCENKKVSACEELLQKAGFEVNAKIEYVESASVKKNLVVKTDPEAGRSIKQGTTITIYKSIGEEVVVVEDYTGRNATEVKELLEAKEVEVTIRKKEPEDKEKKYEDDEIIDQSIVKGSELKKGESIILYVADNEEKFPDFVAEGYTIDDVKAYCSEFELNCNYAEEETEVFAEGKIVYQSRKADTVVAKGSDLTVRYAVKPKQKPKPTGDSSEDE